MCLRWFLARSPQAGRFQFSVFLISGSTTREHAPGSVSMPKSGCNMGLPKHTHQHSYPRWSALISPEECATPHTADRKENQRPTVRAVLQREFRAFFLGQVDIGVSPPPSSVIFRLVNVLPPGMADTIVPWVTHSRVLIPNVIRHVSPKTAASSPSCQYHWPTPLPGQNYFS